ncbi:MAG: PEP-CTERM sorting domain-containing protein [Myxococcota bacterium]
MIRCGKRSWLGGAFAAVLLLGLATSAHAVSQTFILDDHGEKGMVKVTLDDMKIDGKVRVNVWSTGSIKEIFLNFANDDVLKGLKFWGRDLRKIDRDNDHGEIALSLRSHKKDTTFYISNKNMDLGNQIFLDQIFGVKVAEKVKKQVRVKRWVKYRGRYYPRYYSKWVWTTKHVKHWGVVPEPSTAALVGVGLLGLAARSRRQTR